ncbi:hypothetical protein BDR26DRAFT_952563 [Obelidium mucronatum]|nr:hypothetical protein BDR26DRAFT_952563 [Obelidium mucronatum]
MALQQYATLCTCQSRHDLKKHPFKEQPAPKIHYPTDNLNCSNSNQLEEGFNDSNAGELYSSPKDDSPSGEDFPDQILSEDDEEDLIGLDLDQEAVVKSTFPVVSQAPKSFRNGFYAPFQSQLEFRLMVLFSQVGSGTISRELEYQILSTFQLVCDPPAHGRIRALRQDLRLLLGTSPRMCEVSGKGLWYIPISKTIQLAFANPRIRRHLRCLPELSDSISELYHSQKWIDNIPTPMIRLENGGKKQDVFAGEAGDEYVACGFLGLIAERCLILRNQDGVWISAAQMGSRVKFGAGLDIVLVLMDGNDSPKLKMSIRFGAPWRRRAKGMRILVAPITFFNDDTSGNGLPFEKTQQLQNINFISTSKHLSAVESSVAVVASMRELRRGVCAYDAELCEEVLVIGEILQVVGDNPALSSIVSHLGHTSVQPCRMCSIETPTDIDSLMHFVKRPSLSAKLQTFDKTKAVLLGEKQKFLAGGYNDQRANLVLLHNGIKDQFFIKWMKNHFLEPVMNSFLGLEGEEPFFAGPADTPVEILHTVLLGVVKYSTLVTIGNLSAQEKQKLKANIEGVSQLGFAKTIQGHGMVHYVGSCNGKDFRTFVQLAPFVLSSVVGNIELDLWIALSNLTAHLYASEIGDIESYILQLNQYLDQFILHASKLHSSKLSHYSTILKPKFHLLRHIPEFVRRFGPPRLYATEAFESFNKLIRTGIFHTNRLNASKDVAMGFADYANIHHLGDGGYYSLGNSYRNNSLLRTHLDEVKLLEPFKVNSYILIKPGRIILQIASISKTSQTISGTICRMTKQYYLGCPVIEHTQSVKTFPMANCTAINVQHCCGTGCHIGAKRKIDLTRHNATVKHSGTNKYCINIFSFRTRKLVLDLVQPTRNVPLAEIKTTLQEGFVKLRQKRRLNSSDADF